MKILKYVLVVLLILAMIFLALSMITPSISYDSEIIVNKPSEEAWAVMSDESKLPLWIKGFIKSELISGTENTEGAISNIHFDEDGKEMIIQ